MFSTTSVRRCGSAWVFNHKNVNENRIFSFNKNYLMNEFYNQLDDLLLPLLPSLPTLLIVTYWYGSIKWWN